MKKLKVTRTYAFSERDPLLVPGAPRKKSAPAAKVLGEHYTIAGIKFEIVEKDDEFAVKIKRPGERSIWLDSTYETAGGARGAILIWLNEAKP